VWNYDECNAVNTDAVNWKEYKPVGQFYADANTLVHLFGIKQHPVFKDPYNDPKPGAVSGFDENKKKEPTCISVSKFRLDLNSMKIMFKVLEGCSHITTLK